MNHLILLHGATGAKSQLQPWDTAWQHQYQVHALNFTGHGGEPANDEPFSIAGFAMQVLQYMDSNGIDQATVIGYSMGGYVGLYLARHYAQRISKLVTLATKLYWDEAAAAKEVSRLNPVAIEQKVPFFAAELQQRHGPGNWKPLLFKTADLLTAMGRNNPLQPPDFAAIQQPVLVMVGDRDKLVPLQEVVNLYQQLPAARLCILPATPHPIEQVDTEVFVTVVNNFLRTVV